MDTDFGIGIRATETQRSTLHNAITIKAAHAPPKFVLWPKSQAHPAKGGVKKSAKLVTAVNRPMCFGEPLLNCPICVCEPIHPIVCKKPVINCRKTIIASWMGITEVMTGTSGYIRVSAILKTVQKTITRRTPIRSNKAPLWMEKKAARSDLAPAAIPIIVADIPNSIKHQRGTISWIIGKIPLLIKAVEYAVNSSRAERVILPVLIFGELVFCFERLSFKLRARQGLIF